MTLTPDEAFAAGQDGRSLFLYEPALSDLVTRAFAQFHEETTRQAPFVAERIAPWLSARAPQGLEEAFKAPRAYPMLLLPCSLARALRGGPDADFDFDVAFSTINGYLYIRLLDDLMDGDAAADLKNLPAAGLFHHRFESAYRKYFDPAHPFWSAFEAAWCETVDATVEDACLTRIEEADFLAVCGRKFAAAKIPIAAVCHRYGRPDLLAPWSHFLDGLGRWYQMANDLFDWEKDDRMGHRTYVLCEAERRSRNGELVADWIAREGFEWGIETLLRWMAELRARASRLECPEALVQLRFREGFLADQASKGRDGLRLLARLLASLRTTMQSSAT